MLKQVLDAAKAAGDLQQLLDAIPYSQMLGIQVAEATQPPILTLPFKEDNIGNALLPAIHGGVIAGFMEHTALMTILWSGESQALPRTINFSIDYLRPAKAETLYAQCDVARQGRRVANVAITTWQQNINKPVASARGHFLLLSPND